MIELVSIGSGLSLQDAGRCSWRRFGVPSGGAMDQRSLILANTLLGNPATAPVLEIAQLGAQLRVLKDTWLALAGADFSSRVQSGTAVPVRAGEVLNFDQKAVGLFTYLAVPGGFRSTEWLGSASTDLRNGMGRRLKPGDHLEALRALPNVSVERVARRIATETSAHIPKAQIHFKLYPGSQYDAFKASMRKQFIQTTWTVSARSDRSGYRLEGESMKVPASIPSEPVMPGSFQVPGGGQPIITMADGPTVGGYPQIALMRTQDMDSLAQCAPGTKMTFAWID